MEAGVNYQSGGRWIQRCRGVSPNSRQGEVGEFQYEIWMTESIATELLEFLELARQEQRPQWMRRCRYVSGSVVWYPREVSGLEKHQENGVRRFVLGDV
jgi:hypothetical protein